MVSNTKINISKEVYKSKTIDLVSKEFFQDINSV